MTRKSLPRNAVQSTEILRSFRPFVEAKVLERSEWTQREERVAKPHTSDGGARLMNVVKDATGNAND
jgi:hypothetical protein